MWVAVALMLLAFVVWTKIVAVAQLLAPMQVAVVASMLFVALVMWKWMVVG